MKRIFLILALVLALVPATVHAEGTTVMIGAQSVSFGADVGEHFDVPPGPGIALLVGLDVGFPLDLRAGVRNATEENVGGDVKYQWIEVGPRFVLGVEGATIRPDWFFGIGSYDLEMNNVEYDTAIGGYAGLGIEEYISDKYLGRVEVKSSIWKSDTNSLNAATINISLYFGVSF
jgi:hypothetical protein